MDRQFDRFGTSDAIPHFNSSGTALTQAEREQIAKRRGLCVRCGIKTYNVTMIRRTPITNESVYKGHCIRCDPTKVPSNILQEYEHRNPRTSVPVVAARPPSSIASAARATTSLSAAARRAKDRVHSRHSDNGTASASSSVPQHRESRGGAAPSHHHPHHRVSSGEHHHRQQEQYQPPSKGHSSMSAFPPAASPTQKPLRQSTLPPHSKSRELPAPPLMPSNLRDDFNNSSSSGFGGHNSFSTRDDYSVGASIAQGGAARHRIKDDYTGGVSSPSEVDIDLLLGQLKDERPNADLLRETLHRVRNCGCGPDSHAAMAEIRDIMDMYSHDARVMSVACGALWRLAADDQGKKVEAAENGAIESILDSLRKDQMYDDVEYLLWSVGCLASLSDVKEVKALIGERGGIEIIIDVLTRQQESAGVFEWTARALHNLVCEPMDGEDISDLISKNMVSIEDANGVSVIVAATKAHPQEPTALRWGMKLLWLMQDQPDAPEASQRILKKMKDAGFVNGAVKILRARTTGTETDLYRLSAELMCNICVSERSDSAYRDAAECLATVVRCLRDDADGDPDLLAAKQESCCRMISTLMNGSDYSRKRVAEEGGVQAVLEAIEKDSGNLALVHKGLWAFWALSCDDSIRDDALIMKASQVMFITVETQVENMSGLLLPVCGFFGNVCLIPGMNAAVIPIGAIVRALQSVEDDIVLAEAERAVSNFCSKFPGETNLIVEAFDLANVEQVLASHSELSRSFCSLLASVAAKSDTARGRMATPGMLEGLLVKLKYPGSAPMLTPYLELLTTLVIGGNQKATRMPEDLVQVALGVLETSSNITTQITCCALLRNAILSAASPPNVDGLVSTMVRLIENLSLPEGLKAHACGVLWALTGKYSRQDMNALSEMNRALVQILTHYKGDQGPFDYDVLAMAAGALGSVTNSMINNPTHLSGVTSEDVDEVISVPYTALDFESERTELYVRILSSIYNLSFVSDAVLIQCGVIVVVIDTMAEFEQCLEVQQFGCAILAVLASTENLQVNLSIVQTDGIDMIVNALALFADDGVVQSQACKALSHLSIDEESRMLIASLGGLMLLGNTMRANMQDMDLLEGALSAVLSLSADADVELLTESNIVAVVVAVMRQHPTCSQIQEFGMGVLQNISMRCFDSKQSIADAGGIIAVTECIREFMGSPQVLERAFTTLWSLAVLDQNQALIAEADGINLVVNGMMTAITYEGVQKQGCGCLCTLSSDSRNKGLIQNVGGVDSIVFAMWAHYASEEIQVEACRALSSLAVDAQTNEVMIASDGEVNAIISAMRRFPVSDRLQEHACVALRNFLLSADNVDIIRSNENEVRLLVSQASSRFPDQCQERANQVLASLG